MGEVTLKASLIVCHHSNDFRALKEMEGTTDRYIPGSRETMSSVVIKKASGELLQQELALLEINIEDIPTAQKVAEKFKDELSSRPGGKIARDEGAGIFYEIVG